MPSLLWQSWQSSAWTFECASRTTTRSSGHFFVLAYIETVIDLHVPSAASSSSYGEGPASAPPPWTGSSPRRRCVPAATSCTKPGPRLDTVTLNGDVHD